MIDDSSGAPINLGEQTWPALARMLDAGRSVVVLLPIAAIEPHGPHAPLETDAIISSGMCERAARKLAPDDIQVVIAPPLYYGVTRYGASFPGAIGISETTLVALVTEVCGSLMDSGFAHIALVNNHFEPEHREALASAVKGLSTQRGLEVGYLDIPRRANAERLTDEFRSGAAHGGRYETSLVLADKPELVDRDVMSSLREQPVDMPAAMAGGATDFVAMGMDQAYCGAPAEATEEEGQETFAILTEMLIETIRSVVGKD